MGLINQLFLNHYWQKSHIVQDYIVPVAVDIKWPLRAFSDMLEEGSGCIHPYVPPKDLCWWIHGEDLYSALLVQYYLPSSQLKFVETIGFKLGNQYLS
jgi:hypothetical protein